MFETLVVALDLSADGDRALPVVRALASSGRAAVDLVTVSEPGLSTAADAYELERRAVRSGWDRNAWSVVHDVDAVSGLVQHTARRPSPLLVMATTAKRPMTVFGSVTREVLRHAHGPVLLIGPNVPADDVPASTTLVVGIDRHDRHDQVVPAIVDWQSTFASPAPLITEVIGARGDERSARRCLQEAASRLAAQGVDAATRLTGSDDPVDGLLEAAAEVDGPVFVATSARYTDGRLHWHSTTQRLVARATCPVLVVPARLAPLRSRPVADEHIAFHDRTAPAFGGA